MNLIFFITHINLIILAYMTLQFGGGGGKKDSNSVTNMTIQKKNMIKIENIFFKKY